MFLDYTILGKIFLVLLIIVVVSVISVLTNALLGIEWNRYPKWKHYIYDYKEWACFSLVIYLFYLIFLK